MSDSNGKRVAIIGSGNWGSAIARIVGATTQRHTAVFNADVKMWVYEEQLDEGKLSEIINTRHENVKYLPGRKLPTNVRAVTDLVETCADADVLIFVVPHQFVKRICDQLANKLKKGAIAISLIKGVAVGEGGGLKLISENIRAALGIEVAVLMGANLAPEVADEKFCEATVGVKNVESNGALLKQLFHTDYFHINVVADAAAVELCGALKNVVACAAGFSDGLECGDNTKAAIIRIGLMEMIAYVEAMYPGASKSTFFESCGVADLITTCYGGRNRRVCEAFAKTGKSIAALEKELLNGQSAQGPPTAAELFETLEKKQLTSKFPLFVAVHKICQQTMPASALIDQLKQQS